MGEEARAVTKRGVCNDRGRARPQRRGHHRQTAPSDSQRWAIGSALTEKSRTKTRAMDMARVL